MDKNARVSETQETYPSNKILATGNINIRDVQEDFTNRKILAGVDKSAFFPLSFAQQRLWFLQQLQPDNCFYNIFQVFHFPFIVDIVLLKRALDEIIRRHSILRTRFVMRDNGPLQMVSDVGELPLLEVDLRAWPAAEKRFEFDRISAAQASLPFDLSGDSMARGALVYLDAQDTAFLLTFHHIVTDAWSLQLFYNELKLIYEAFSSGKPSPLPELCMQYVDYAARERDFLSGDTMESYLVFWRKQLEDLPMLKLPTQKIRPDIPSFRGQARMFDVPQPVYSRLRKLSGEHNCTLFVTLLSAFKTLLFRYTAQEDIVVGCPFSGRTQVDLENMIGFFVNTLVLRSQFSAQNSFDELLEIVKQVSIDAFSHAELPFEKLVEELHPERDISRNPLFQVIFQLLSAKNNDVSPHDSVSDVMSGGARISKFDLTLSMSEEGGGLGGYVEYNTDLFTADSIDRMVAHFLSLLKSIVEDPSKPVCRLELMGIEERQLLLEGFNQTARRYDQDRWVHELISEHAAMHPQSIAVFTADEQWTYQWLERLSNQLAHYLRNTGIDQEQLVAVALPRSASMVAVHLAILKAGAAFVPLDIAYPAERLAFMLDDVQAALLITDAIQFGQLPHTDTPVLMLQEILEACGNDPVAALQTTLLAQHRCYVMYTSGSTGKPKGVELHHGGFLNLVQWNKEAYDITPDDRSLQMATPAYDAYIYEVFPALAAGASIYLIDELDRTSPQELRQQIKEQKITFSFISTAMGEAVMQDPWPDNTSLRILAIGGEKLSQVPVKEPSFRYLNFYGPTENTVMSTFCPVPFDGSGAPPIGRGVANVQLYVLDAFLNPVPVGITGELYIGGAGVARGYLKRPRLTAERFLPDLFSKTPGARLYRTGDLVRFRPDGNLDFVGRTDHQVKLRGFRIELEEVERALLAHPAVQEAVVVLQHGQPGSGGATSRLTAFVALQPAGSTDAQQLRSWLKDQLPQFMIPSQLIVLPELPKSFNGKIDRKTLQQQGAPCDVHEVAGTETGARTPLEKSIAGVWAELLPSASIMIERNFFDMGGHSLLIAQMQHRLRQLLHRDIPLVDLFQYPTIRSLSQHLEALPKNGQAKKLTEDRASKQRRAFQNQRWNVR